jgi:hypothetical protein
MLRGRLIVSFVVGGALALTVAPAWAHTAIRAPETRVVDLPATVLHAGAPSAPVLPVALGVLVALAACASRRRVAMALLLLTAAVGVDAAVHSVHHLNDAKAGAGCVLASSSTHAPAAVADASPVPARLEPNGLAGADAAPLRVVLESSRPDRGRAPPSSAA